MLIIRLSAYFETNVDGDISEWESDWETEEEDENVTRQESLQNPGSSKPSTSSSGESCRMSQVWYNSLHFVLFSQKIICCHS